MELRVVRAPATRAIAYEATYWQLHYLSAIYTNSQQHSRLRCGKLNPRATPGSGSGSFGYGLHLMGWHSSSLCEVHRSFASLRMTSDWECFALVPAAHSDRAGKVSPYARVAL